MFEIGSELRLSSRRSVRSEGRVRRSHPEKISTDPSLPGAPNEWAYTGSRYRGPTKACREKEAAPYQGDVAFTIELLSLMEDDFRLFGQMLREIYVVSRSKKFLVSKNSGRTRSRRFRRKPGA